MVTTVKVLSSCKSVLPSQFLGLRGRTHSQKKLKTASYLKKERNIKFDRKVRLVVKNYANFKKNTYI